MLIILITNTTALASSKYIIDRGFQNPEYDLEALYTVVSSDITAMELKLLRR